MADERIQRPAFGALLRARRVAAGYTQDDLAERARISVQAVSALERGARLAPRGETLALLTQALELEADALFEFEAAAQAAVKTKVRSKQPLFKAPSRKRAQLPQFATAFVGRDRIAHDLAEAILGGGCTTLWGTGGVGKTRLAVEATSLVEDRFERIVFVALAATIGDDAVEDAIASAFEIKPAPGENVISRIVGELCERRTLVIVDNCEHVIAGVARAIDALSGAGIDSAFVCTSREPLRIAGERVIDIGPLEVDDARRLFVDLAGTAARDGRDVETICRKLDGIPLALELAAACARVLDLEHVASGLEQRFRLLTRGSRAVTDRHTTLRATIAWSYDLLDACERRVFERAAIINGGFSLNDLLAIAVETGCDRASVLAAIAALTDKSLVVAEFDGETLRRRYRLLDSMRAFALEIAAAHDGGASVVEGYRRLGGYLTEQLRHSIEAYRKSESSPLGDISLDYIRGYLDWAIEKGNDVAAGTMLAGEIHLTWDLYGLHLEGLRRIEAGVALLTDADSDAVAAMFGYYAISRLNQRLVRIAESLAPAMRAYDLAARVGDDVMRAASAAKLAFAYDVMGDPKEALGYAKEAMNVCDRIGDREGAAFAACTLAVIAFKVRGDDAAIEDLRTAVEGQRALSDVRRTASAELYLGEAYYERGYFDSAIATASSAIAEFRKTASPFELAIGLNNLGIYFTGAKSFADAAAPAVEALHIGRERGYTRMIVLAAQTCATISALGGREPRRSVQLFGYVAGRYETIGEIGYTEVTAHDRLKKAVAGSLPEFDFTQALLEGEAFDDATAIHAALRCAEAT